MLRPEPSSPAAPPHSPRSLPSLLTRFYVTGQRELQAMPNAAVGWARRARWSLVGDFGRRDPCEEGGRRTLPGLELGWGGREGGREESRSPSEPFPCCCLPGPLPPTRRLRGPRGLGGTFLPSLEAAGPPRHGHSASAGPAPTAAAAPQGLGPALRGAPSPRGRHRHQAPRKLEILPKHEHTRVPGPLSHTDTTRGQREGQRRKLHSVCGREPTGSHALGQPRPRAHKLGYLNVLVNSIKSPK